MNPVHYIFDPLKLDEEILEVKYSIPYADITSLSEAELKYFTEKGYPVEFGHSLTDLLGGQLDAGLVITDMYEDYMSDSPLRHHHPNYIATRAVKSK